MLNLCDFLEMCDPNMKVAITNENGDGGAAYVAWPEHGWTVKEAIENLGCGAYHVCEVSIMGDMLYITADENQWDFGSYWNGQWHYDDDDGYKVELTATMYTVETCEEDALRTAMDMFDNREASDIELRIVEKYPIEHVVEHWSW